MSDRMDELQFEEISASSACGAEYHKTAALWALRILVRLGGYKRFWETVMDKDELLEAAGLEDAVMATDDEQLPSKLRQLLRARLIELERKPPMKLGPLANNLRLLSQALCLSAVDCKVLAFAVVLHNVDWLSNAAQTLKGLDRRSTVSAIAKILNLPRNQIERALDPNAVLGAAGILRLNPEWRELKHKIDLLDAFATILTQPHRNAREMLKPFFRYPDSARLGRSDYAYVRTEWSLVADYLNATLGDKRTGINILIHGRPGTGKTEFVRAIAAELNIKLCEVATQDADNNALRPSRRFGAYLLAQRVLMRINRHALLFDEIEDVFPQTAAVFGMLMSQDEGISKAWMNRALEENPVPCFWLSNHIEQIDPAYLRRFDLVIEMPEPTRSVRRKMLQRYLDGIPVTECWLDRMAENADLMPAIIERAAKVVRSLKPANTEQAERQFESVLRGTLEAMGHHMVPRGQCDELIPYRLEYLNPDHDLSGIVEGLKWRSQGRLCLYGPPGTGKTAFGKHLAKELDRPLLVKRASDLLSMWVGGTEKNIARMYREAEREEAVLLLDEADSFLQDRASAQRSWEITQVNELLTQMELFEGLFIASTNLMDSLDHASLRRFDIKVHFNYLTVKQREAIFLEALSALGVQDKTLGEATRRRLQALDTLVPGDFAVVARQSCLVKAPPNQAVLLANLAAECAIKNKGKSRSIGFIEG